MSISPVDSFLASTPSALSPRIANVASHAGVDRHAPRRSPWLPLACASLLAGGLGCEIGSGNLPNEEGSGLASGEHLEADEAGMELSHELLAEVDLGDAIVAFHRFDSPSGNTRVSVSEAAPGNATRTPLSELARMELTHLEMFKALAPDQQPPELLETLHDFEVEGLGRAHAGVRRVELDLSVALSKSTTGCRNFVFEDPPDNCGVRTWTNGRQATYISGFKGLHVGQYWAYSTTKQVTLGICNESDATIYGRIGIDMGGDNSSAYSYWGWATLQPGWMWRWWDFREANVCRNCPFDRICNTVWNCLEPSRYRVDGSSANGKLYHLYTAEAYQPDCSTP